MFAEHVDGRLQVDTTQETKYKNFFKNHRI